MGHSVCVMANLVLTNLANLTNLFRIINGCGFYRHIPTNQPTDKVFLGNRIDIVFGTHHVQSVLYCTMYNVHGGTGGCVDRGVWILSRPALSSYTPPCGPAAQIYSECINHTLFGHYPHISVLIEAQQFFDSLSTESPPFRILGKNRTLSPPAGPRHRGGDHQTKKKVKMFICCFLKKSCFLISIFVKCW